MRYLILAAGLIAAASPAAFAQSSPSFPREMDDEIVRSLPAPEEVEDMAHVAGDAADAILDVPVGGLINAIDPRRRVHRDTTVAEVAARRDPYLRERVRDSLSGLAVGMEDVIAQVAIVAPELRRSLAGLEQGIQRAMDGRRGGYDRYDRDYDPDYADEYERSRR